MTDKNALDATAEQIKAIREAKEKEWEAWKSDPLEKLEADIQDEMRGDK